MSSKIDRLDSANLQQAHHIQRQRKKAPAPKTADLRVNKNISGGVKAGAKAALGGSADLKKLIESRKLSKPVDELAGIKDLKAHFFIHSGSDRRVVQLREVKSSKLVRQVPDQDALNRLTSMRRFARRKVDILV